VTHLIFSKNIFSDKTISVAFRSLKRLTQSSA